MSPNTFFQRLPAFFPGIVSSRFYDTWDFYTTVFGFRTVTECNDYVQLQHSTGAQIAILRHETDGNPAELITGTEGRGFWLNLEVANVDAEYQRLSEAQVPIVSPPETQPWGDRHFVVRDPNGVLIYVAERQQRLPLTEPTLVTVA
ncbi:MAG TPA: VOC family protein [Opitutaceae bacterium]|nr:VOC family protein [Opitutaceae bacterium]